MNVPGDLVFSRGTLILHDEANERSSVTHVSRARPGLACFVISVRGSQSNYLSYRDACCDRWQPGGWALVIVDGRLGWVQREWVGNKKDEGP